MDSSDDDFVISRPKLTSHGKRPRLVVNSDSDELEEIVTPQKKR